MYYTDGIHLIADTNVKQLHNFCNNVLGISRYYYHNPYGKHKPHYDIIAKRAKARVNSFCALKRIQRVSSRRIVELLQQTYKPYVVNLRSSPYDIYIGRRGHGFDGYFGNPFILYPGMQPGDTIAKYKVYFYARLKTDAEFKRRVLELKGKVLGCFCKPRSCHGDVIIEYLKTQ